MQKGYLIGIDEVGRGPLAGPVTVCAVLVQRDFSLTQFARSIHLPLRDSKKISEKERELWFKEIKKEKRIKYKIVSISPQRIDRMNISKTANCAAGMSIKKLSKDWFKNVQNARIYLDGGLFLSKKDLEKIRAKHIPKMIIKGDEKIPAISIASIIAKVTRDAYMKRLHQKYPKYDFKTHKGYGTRAHRIAIRNNGLTPHHRKSFIHFVSHKHHSN